jgi:hypothetical protein
LVQALSDPKVLASIQEHLRQTSIPGNGASGSDAAEKLEELAAATNNKNARAGLIRYAEELKGVLSASLSGNAHEFSRLFDGLLSRMDMTASSGDRGSVEADTPGSSSGKIVRMLTKPAASGLQAPDAPDMVSGKAVADSIISAINKSQLPTQVRINPLRNSATILLLRMYNGFVFDDERNDQRAEALHDWLLAQPDHSVGPDALFLQSLRIADGNVWDALTAGWNVLASGRTDGGRERNYLPRMQKLMDLRGDSALLPVLHNLNDSHYQWTSKADNFSAWYHFWGTMLSAFFRDEAFVALPLPGKYIVMGEVLVEELFIGVLEHATKLEWKAFLDMPKRIGIDIQGVMAGSRLARELRAKTDAHMMRGPSRMLRFSLPLIVLAALMAISPAALGEILDFLRATGVIAMIAAKALSLGAAILMAFSALARALQRIGWLKKQE